MKSLLQKDKRCYICGSIRALHKHHIFRGNKRQVSEDEGMWVYLCEPHHTGIYGVHNNIELDNYLKSKAKRVFLDTHSLEEFIEKFGGKTSE